MIGWDLLALGLPAAGQGFDAGSIWVCAGNRATSVDADPSGVPRLRLGTPDATDRYVPSADRLAAQRPARLSSMSSRGPGRKRYSARVTSSPKLGSVARRERKSERAVASSRTSPPWKVSDASASLTIADWAGSPIVTSSSI